MLLKLLAFASLVGSVIFLVSGFIAKDLWLVLPLILAGVFSFAILNALADIVDHLEDIRNNANKSNKS